MSSARGLTVAAILGAFTWRSGKRGCVSTLRFSYQRLLKK